MKHKCMRSRTCLCYLLASAPAEDCPLHGSGEYPFRCGECGKFMPSEDYDYCGAETGNIMYATVCNEKPTCDCLRCKDHCECEEDDMAEKKGTKGIERNYGRNDLDT